MAPGKATSANAPALTVQHEQWRRDGYCILPPIIDANACAEILAHVPDISTLSGSRRDLLKYDWCRAIANDVRSHPALRNFLPAHYVAVQCTYFEKSLQKNWLVSWHQDLSIPVAHRTENENLLGWSEKEESLFVQAPAELLSTMLAVRLHLDDCNAEDGALRVLPQSHLAGRLNSEQILRCSRLGNEVSCHVDQGGAMLMRPLLLHASSKSTGKSLRRVLHFLFGPRELPYELKWQHAI